MEDLDTRILALSDLDRVSLIKDLIRLDAQAQNVAKAGARARNGTPSRQRADEARAENGFYYDLDMPHRISPEDFPKIEEEMKREIKANHVFEKTVVSRDEAIALAESGRLGRIIYFLRFRSPATGATPRDMTLCQKLADKLQAKGQWSGEYSV